MEDHQIEVTTGGFDRRAEVEAILEVDDPSLGDVFRQEKAGKSVAQIAENSGTTTGPVYANIRLRQALVEGTSMASPTVASGWAARIRTWLQHKPLSDQLRNALEKQHEELKEAASNPEAAKVESAEAVTKSEQAEAENVSGVYVYTLPHYVRHPFDRKSGRTLLKVGHSSKSAHYRANDQARRSTELPEDPWLLRIYPAESSVEAEEKFHDFLRNADHQGVRGNRNGAEWFLTSLKFLDLIATTHGLEVKVINDFEIPDDD